MGHPAGLTRRSSHVRWLAPAQRCGVQPTNTDTLLSLVIELLFAAVFLRAVLEYSRHRDPINRDVILVFSAMAALFVAQIVRIATGVPQGSTGSGPTSVVLTATGVVAIILLLLQPLLTLRLVGQLRPVPRWQLVWPLALYLGSVPVAVLGGDLGRLLGLIGLLVAFCVSEAIAGGYLLREASDHMGAARFRLLIAAGSTLLFAAALFAAGAGSLGPDVAPAAGATGRILALIAGLGYVTAFMPPRWLRRIWQAGAGYRFTEELLATSASDSENELWRRFAGIARFSSGADGVAIFLASNSRSPAFHGGGIDPPATLPGQADIRRLLVTSATGVQVRVDETQPFLMELARAVGAKFVSVVPIRLRDGGVGCVLLLAGWRTLFTADDSELIAATATQTALLGERQLLLADQRRLGEQLSVTIEALENASRAKSDFLASMSHELRTPLNAIIGFSELMRSEPTDGSTLTVPAEWVEHIHSSGQHLLGLINDVLDITKVEAGRLDLAFETVDVSQAIAESVGGLRPLAERKDIELESETDRAPIEVDRGRLRQMLYNLLSNAIKFTPRGGTIRINTAAADNFVRIAVADTGVGIAPEDQAHVFEEFRQVGDVAQRQEGTGLGLALTRRLVEAHGGTIELESEPGKGTTFTITLPRTQAQPERRVIGEAARPLATPGAVAAGAAGSAAGATSPAARHTPLVLIIEDEPSAARLLRTYAESMDVEVVVANDGERGVAAAHERSPDAIVLDVLLPGIDGWEVLRELKSDPSTRNVPVIIVTIVDERDVGLALGAVDYFVKPVDRVALIDRLSHLTLTTKVKQREVTVLAVDDDPASVAMVEAALGPEGFTVVPAYDGRQALDLARQHPPDLVICDLLMPDLDGFGVVSALKAEPRTQEVPIIVLTAHELSAEEKSRLNGKILGVVGKGEAAAAGLRDWLVRVGAGAPDLAGQPGHMP
jgi:signal transduction histidine kinase/DNA-binding response OmpR family regulator